MTLRELFIRQDACQIDRWWHTSFIVSTVYNLQTIVANAINKRNHLKPKTPASLHPFVDPTIAPDSTRITPKNISILQRYGDAMCSQ